MFKLDKNRIIITSLPIIVDNYEVLLFNDGPILYSGFNKDGNIIIGSSVDEDYEKKIERHFHSQVSKEIYFNFLKQEISYRKLLEEVQSFFVIDNSFDGKITTIYLVNINDIPEDYLPTHEAYCPEEVYKPVYEYSMNYTGGLANQYTAIISDVTKTQEGFKQLVSSIKTPNLDVKTEPYLHIRKAASFDLNFIIKVNHGHQLDAFFDEEKFMTFFYQYIDYCSNHLFDEVDLFSSDNLDNFPNFKSLYNNFNELYNIHGIQIDGNPKEILQEEIRKSANIIEDITDIIGKNFTTIDFSAITKDRVKPICIFDSAYNKKIEKTNILIERYLPEQQEDPEYREYKVHIYDLNTETRKGWLYLQLDNLRPKVKFSISGDEPLEESKYTRSLDKGEVIPIRGKAKRYKEAFNKLEIEFEKE